MLTLLGPQSLANPVGQELPEGSQADPKAAAGALLRAVARLDDVAVLYAGDSLLNSVSVSGSPLPSVVALALAVYVDRENARGETLTAKKAMRAAEALAPSDDRDSVRALHAIQKSEDALFSFQKRVAERAGGEQLERDEAFRDLLAEAKHDIDDATELLNATGTNSTIAAIVERALASQVVIQAFAMPLEKGVTHFEQALKRLSSSATAS